MKKLFALFLTFMLLFSLFATAIALDTAESVDKASVQEDSALDIPLEDPYYGKLVYYNLYIFTGDLNNRLVKIDKFLRETVFKHWEPDFVVMEDIQYQNGVLTFKVLAMLLGLVQTACCAAGVPFEVVSPNV